MTAVAPPPPPAPPAPPPPPRGPHGGPRPHSDFAEVLDRLPRAGPKESAPAPKEKRPAPEAAGPAKPPEAGAQAWAALLALSQAAAAKPSTGHAPDIVAKPSPPIHSEPAALKQPRIAAAPAPPAVAARLLGARAFLAPSGAVPPASALAPTAEAFLVPTEAPNPSPAAAAEEVAGQPTSKAAQASVALPPKLPSPPPVVRAGATVAPARASPAKGESPSPKQAPRQAAPPETAPESGVVRRPQPAAPAEKGESAASAAPSDSRPDGAAGAAGPQNPAVDLAAPQWAPSSAADASPAKSNASPAPTPAAQPAPILSAGREPRAPVREIDVDLAPTGLEDVSMTMRLQGERLSVVIRAGSGQTASAIEGAREAIAEGLAAIGQPLASLLIERTSPSAEGNGTNDGFEQGQRPQGGGEDQRGGRRGAPRGF